MKNGFLILVIIIANTIYPIHYSNAYNNSLFPNALLEEIEIQTNSTTEQNDINTDNIRIISLLPNPDGTDIGSTEIKIKNKNLYKIKLKDWNIKTNYDEYIFNSEEIDSMQTKSFSVVNKKPIYLKNSKDQLIFKTSNSKIVQKISYTNAPENAYLVLDESTGLFEFRDLVERKKPVNIVEYKEAENLTPKVSDKKEAELKTTNLSSILETKKITSSVTDYEKSDFNELPNHIPSFIMMLLLSLSFTLLILKWKLIFQ